MPLPGADNGGPPRAYPLEALLTVAASPQSTNEWGDPTDATGDAPADVLPQDLYDVPPGGLDTSTQSEPKQFRQLQTGDQRFLKQLDTETAKLQFSGEYLGLAAGVTFCAVLRFRRGLSPMPFARLLEQTPPNYLPNATMDYVNGGLIGSVVGRLISNNYGWSSLNGRLDAEPAIAARIQSAMDARENKEAFRKYRSAWYEAQQGLTIPQKFWYRFSYTSC